MVRNLSARIAALWRAVTALATGRRPGTARETQTMKAHGPGGAPAATRDEPMRGAPMPGESGLPHGFHEGFAAGDELLSRAMASLGIDVDDFAMREAALLRDMRRICRSCDARSRCRRDLGTGDFARRYRHYCPVTENLSLIVLRASARRPAGRA